MSIIKGRLENGGGIVDKEGKAKEEKKAGSVKEEAIKGTRSERVKLTLSNW